MSVIKDYFSGVFRITKSNTHMTQAIKLGAVDGYAEYPGEQYPVMTTYRDGMERITVDAVLEKVSLAMDRYVQP